MKIIDPRKIPQGAMPLIVLSNQKNSLIGRLIDFKTALKGLPPYDHAMLSIDVGQFVCQSFTGYNKIKMDEYLIKDGQLAFAQLTHCNSDALNAFRQSVLNRLSGAWYTKCYDFLGIFGQAINVPAIHTPGLEFCSVDVIRHLKAAAPYLPSLDRQIIQAIPPESNPEFLWQVIVNNPDVFKVYGTWDSDTGVVV